MTFLSSLFTFEFVVAVFFACVLLQLTHKDRSADNTLRTQSFVYMGILVFAAMALASGNLMVASMLLFTKDAGTQAANFLGNVFDDSSDSRAAAYAALLGKMVLKNND